MSKWLALPAAYLGVLALFCLSRSVRTGLTEVADSFSLVDDDEEEDWVLPLDEVGYTIDDATDDLFSDIAGKLGDVERLGNKIARREERA